MADTAPTFDDVRPGRILALTWARLAVANLVGAVLLFVFFDRISPPTGSSEHLADLGYRHRVSLAVFVLYVVAMFPAGVLLTKRVILRRYLWLDERRPPTPDERDVALREPFRLAMASFAAWLGAAVVFALLNAAFGHRFVQVARTFVGVIFGGFTTSLLTYLLVERTLRPIFALALAGGPPGRRRYLGVRPRLMLSWALGSAIPLAGIALAVVGPSHVENPAGPAAFLAIVGVAGGWVSMYVAARSVSDPLEGVRRAIGRVEAGHLDVEVTVDDGGEVGLLQAGVNRMVAGLRERQHLRDLFGRHVGDEVARQALGRGAGLGLGGEQREASALFIDLIGSTALAASRPATEVVDTLNALFDAVVRCVGAEGGWVNKFEGDGALCVFGAPADQPDHAARALRAARSLRDELARLRAEGRAALDAGIGVSSGTVVAGNVGAEERYEYTVIGDPVNEAARLTELAKEHPARVLAGEQAVRAAGSNGGGGEEARWTLVGEFELRGRGSPTRAYAPVDSGTVDAGTADTEVAHRR